MEKTITCNRTAKSYTSSRFIQPWIKEVADGLLKKLVKDGDIKEFDGPHCSITFENALQTAFDEGEIFANAKREG